MNFAGRQIKNEDWLWEKAGFAYVCKSMVIMPDNHALQTAPQFKSFTSLSGRFNSRFVRIRNVIPWETTITLCASSISFKQWDCIITASCCPAARCSAGFPARSVWLWQGSYNRQRPAFLPAPRKASVRCAKTVRFLFLSVQNPWWIWFSPLHFRGFPRGVSNRVSTFFPLKNK